MTLAIALILVLIAVWLLRRPPDVSANPRRASVSSSHLPDVKAYRHRTIRTKVRGVSFYTRQSIIRSCCNEGDALALIREPQNSKDPNAVKVCRLVMGDSQPIVGDQIGYVSRELAEEIAPFLDNGATATTQIIGVTGG